MKKWQKLQIFTNIFKNYRSRLVQSSGITACMRIQVCIGHSGVYRVHYRDIKGRLFVSYKSYLVLLKYMIS